MTAWCPECANPVDGPDDDLDCWYCEHCEHWIADDEIIVDEQVEALDQAIEHTTAAVALQREMRCPECSRELDREHYWYCSHCDRVFLESELYAAEAPNQFIDTDKMAGGSADPIPVALIVTMFNESEPQSHGWALTQRSIKTPAPYPVRDISLTYNSDGNLADLNEYLPF